MIDGCDARKSSILPHYLTPEVVLATNWWDAGKSSVHAKPGTRDGLSNKLVGHQEEPKVIPLTDTRGGPVDRSVGHQEELQVVPLPDTKGGPSNRLACRWEEFSLSSLTDTNGGQGDEMLTVWHVAKMNLKSPCCMTPGVVRATNRCLH